MTHGVFFLQIGFPGPGLRNLKAALDLLKEQGAPIQFRLLLGRPTWIFQVSQETAEVVGGLPWE